MDDEKKNIDFAKIGINDNFMFGHLMKEEKRCKPFLEQILNIKIDHIEYVEREKDIKISNLAHGIRLDIYAEDGKTVYNCEMQTTNTGNLPKRSRYYQGQIDLHLLNTGRDYNMLKKTYIIFICNFDLWGENKYIYRFENRCIDNFQLRLGDESIKIFVNTKGILGDVSDEFKELVHFLDTSEIKKYKNSLVNDLADALAEARSDEEWRREYMTWTTYTNQILEQGIQQGQNEEREKAIKNIVESAQKYNANKENVTQDILERYPEYNGEKMTYSNAKKIVEKYWNENIGDSEKKN